MKLSFYNITKEDTSIIKAFAIVAIVFHNFLHLKLPIGENEMSFEPDRVWGFFRFIEANPTQIIDAIVSYLGHYGVELFIFMSAYGLAKTFIQREVPQYHVYLYHRVVKLYALLLVGIVACFLIYLDTWNFSIYKKDVVLLSLTMHKNFSYATLFNGVGPWWYFSLALQLYILFPLLYKGIVTYREKGFFISLIIIYAAIYLLLPITEKYSFPMFGNFLGHLPEFVLGIALATQKELKISWIVILLALVLFVLANFYQAFFPFSYLTITILLLTCTYVFCKYAPRQLKKPVVFVGQISMFIFLINGPLRMKTYHWFLGMYSFTPLVASLFHFAVVLFFSWLMYLAYEKIASYIRNNTKIPL